MRSLYPGKHSSLSVLICHCAFSIENPLSEESHDGSFDSYESCRLLLRTREANARNVGDESGGGLDPVCGYGLHCMPRGHGATPVSALRCRLSRRRIGAVRVPLLSTKLKRFQNL